jgi:nucleotide-binding universal stress UspA family protein
MTVPRIIVGIDFSPGSKLALDHATALARRRGAALVLVHADALPELPALPGGLEPEPMRAVRAQLEAERVTERHALDELRRGLIERGVLASGREVAGFADEALCDVAAELAAELVVVASHGRTDLTWLPLGEVAHVVTRLAPSSVLVARGEALASGYRRVCVGVDFSAATPAVLRQAIAVAAPDAVIDVVHFWHLAPPDEAVARALRQQGARLLVEHANGVAACFHAVCEPPLPGLVGWIERGTYDLVVLGANGHRGARQGILGRVAEEAAQRCRASVLLVRPGVRRG